MVQVILPWIFADGETLPHLVLHLRFTHIFDELTDRLLDSAVVWSLESVVYALREVKAQLRQVRSTQLAHWDALSKAEVNRLIGDAVQVNLKHLLVHLMQQLARICIK